MPNVHFLPDDRWVGALPGESVLEMALRAGIEHAHACGGQGRCSTCRVQVMAGADKCPPRTAAERVLAERIGLGTSVRLGCQLVPTGNLEIRRLVLDDDDVALVDQRRRLQARTAVGEERELAILFADIRGFTAFAEQMPPHDVVHALNRYFHLMGSVVAQHGGTINNYMGDGFMALFGLDESHGDHVAAAVLCGVDMLGAMSGLQPYLEKAYNRTFDIGIGVHVGDVVIGTVGASGGERMTAIGDAVNVASRIEAANKLVGSRFLVSDAVVQRLTGRATLGRTLTLSLPGLRGEHVLHEVIGSR